VAAIVAVWLLLTAVVLAVKVAVVAPAAMLTDAGTVTNGALLARVTTAAEEAGALSETVQVEEAPPLTLVG
jgi:hypothetical protein